MADPTAPVSTQPSASPSMGGAIKVFPPPAELVQPFASLDELKDEHSALQRRRRGNFSEDQVSEEIALFLYRGHATGALLCSDDERYAAQGLLTYWSNILYRRGGEVADDSLAPFDPALAPMLTDTADPYQNIGRPIADGRSPGWERLLNEAIRAIGDNRLAAVIGASGSGRFQLIRDGVLPALRSGAISGSENWVFVPTFAPADVPLTRLIRAFAPGGVGFTGSRLANDPVGQGHSLAAARPSPTVVVVERLDEMLTASDLTQARAFCTALLTLVESEQGHRVIVLSDPSGLGPVDALGPFGPRFRRGQVLVTFTAAELRQMIVEPAQRVGLRFDDGLVDRLLFDVQGDPASLALLQFTLRLLWESRSGNRITHETYDRQGGGRLAVARRAEAVFTELSESEQKVAQRMLMRFIRPATGAGVSCRRVAKDQLITTGGPEGEESSVLQKLLAAGLLVPVEDASGGVAEYSPVHESLATSWPRFLGWLEEVRERQQWRARLRAAAEQWQDQKRETGTLWSGAVLTLAQQDADRLKAAGEPLDSLEQEFLDASRKRDLRRRVVQWLAVAVLGAACIAPFGIYQRYHNKSVQEKQIYESEKDKAALKFADESAKAEALINASWELEEGARLAEEQDTAGAYLWYAKAWQRFQSTVGPDLDQKQKRFQDNYLVRLGASARQLPALAGMAYPYSGDPPPVSSAGNTLLPLAAMTPSGKRVLTVEDAGSNQPAITRLWTYSEQAAQWQWIRSGPLASLTKGDLSTITGAYISDDGGVAIVTEAETDAKKGIVTVWVFGQDPLTTKPVTMNFDGRLRQAAISPDGRYFAIVSESGSATRLNVWRKDHGWSKVVLNGPANAGNLSAVAFSPTSDRFAVAVESKPDVVQDSVVCLEWDQLKNLTADRQPKPYTASGPIAAVAAGEEVTFVAYSQQSDGQLLFVSRSSELAMVPPDAWLFATRQSQPGLKLDSQHHGPIMYAAFSPAGNRLATAGADGAVEVWHIIGRGDGQLGVRWGLTLGRSTADAKNPEAGRARAHDARVFNVQFSPDGRHIATASRDRRARVWVADTGLAAHPWLFHTGSVDQVRFDADGRHLMTASQGAVYRWELTGGEVRPEPFVLPGPLAIVTATPDGQAVLAAGSRKSDLGEARTESAGWVQVWRAPAGDRKFPAIPVLDCPLGVRHAALSPNGRFVSAVGGDRKLHLWNVSDPSPQLLELPERDPWQTVYTAFGGTGSLTYLLEVAQEAPGHFSAARVQVWKMDDAGQPAKVGSFKADVPLALAAFSPDCKQVVAHTGQRSPGEVIVWETGSTNDGVRLRRTDLPAGAHAEAITSVTFNGQGNELLTTSRDDQAVVWSRSTADAKTWVGQKLSGKSNSDVVERHTADVLFAAFNNTGDGIVTAGADRQAIVWERSSTGKPFRPTAFLPLLSAPIDVAFSPEHEQRYVMTADESGTVRLWDAKDGRTIVVRHHSGQLRRLAGRAGGSHVLILGTEVRSQKRNLFGIPVMRGAEPTVVDRLTFADWDLTPAQLPDTNNLRAIAEMTASRRLFDPKELKAEEAGKRDFIQMTPLTPDRVFRHWLDVGKAARSGP